MRNKGEWWLRDPVIWFLILSAIMFLGFLGYAVNEFDHAVKSMRFQKKLNEQQHKKYESTY